jgi:hypothetical protein
MGTDDNQAKLKIFEAESCINCYPPSILPIVFNNISGYRMNGNNRIDYELFSDENLIGELILERSLDGIRFVQIAVNDIEFGENENQSSFFIDLSPSDDINYYRIKLKNADDKIVTYSEIISIDPILSNQISVYPTLISNGEELHISSLQTIDEIQIYSMYGSLVQRIQPELENVSEMNYDTDLNPGIYYLKVLPNNKESAKVVVY